MAYDSIAKQTRLWIMRWLCKQPMSCVGLRCGTAWVAWLDNAVALLQCCHEPWCFVPTFASR